MSKTFATLACSTFIFHFAIFITNTHGDRATSAVRQPATFAVSLQQLQRPSTRRHLLRSGSLNVQGAVREVGYFYATLKLGTPAIAYNVIIDTGSTITYIPCKGCHHCGTHQAQWFDPDASSTAKKLGCSDPLCNCGSPSCSCRDNRCYYSRTYAERSSSEGWLIEDEFGFPDEHGPVRMVFGCEDGETGEIYRQMADGIMGMGNNHNAFQSQLVARGIIEDVFSLCFGYPKDGILLLGDVAMPDGVATAYTPLLNDLRMHYYNVKMEGITVNDGHLPLDLSMFDRGYGVVLDSGTTFTYLPTDAFNALAKAVGDYVETKGLQRTPGADPQYNDICWKGAPDAFNSLENFFPKAEFVFGGGAKLLLTPSRYLFLSRPAEYCLGVFDNGGSGTLIGGVSVRDVVITYDRRNNRVGFTDTSCANMRNVMAQRSNASRAAQPPPSVPPPSSPRLSPPPPSTPVSQPPPSSPVLSPPPPSTPLSSPSPPSAAPPPSSSASRTSSPTPMKHKRSSSPAPSPAQTPQPEEHPKATEEPGGSARQNTSGVQAPSLPAPSAYREAVVKTKALGGHGTLIGVFIAVLLFGAIAEVYIFRRHKVSQWFRRKVQGVQDETELAPLSQGPKLGLNEAA